MTTSNFTTEKSYFRNNPNFGRTTKLIEKATGKVVFEGMGVCTKAELIKSMLSKHFDLFNLIEEGLALDKTTLKQKDEI